MMRKFLMASLALGVLMLASCKKESYYHTMRIDYPLGMKYIYADQPLDSVVFSTTDNFQVSSSASWVAIPEQAASGKIQNTYRYVWQVAVPIYFAANTEGKMRQAEISVHTWGDDDWNQTGRVNFTQFSWHDVYVPVPNYAYANGVVTQAYFEATDSATQVADTLKFSVHHAWTLTDGIFVHPDTLAGDAGDNVVVVHLDPNTAAGKRDDEIRLQTVDGAYTTIKFTQTEPKAN